MKPETVNVAYCVMRSTLVKRHFTGRGRPATYVHGPDAIAQAARQLAESVLAEAGIQIISGIFIDATEQTWQHENCLCCAKPLDDECPQFLIDRDTLQVLPPDENSDRGTFWRIGPECRKQYPGIGTYQRALKGGGQ